MSKTAALYVRVSTLEPSCDLQLEELRRYASRRFSQVSEFMDIGTSGASEAR